MRHEKSSFTLRSLLVAGVISLGACDTNVTNPGPVQDDFLSNAEAHDALVNGMGRATAEALNWISYTGASVAREIHPSGSTGSFGITVLWQRGELSAIDTDLDTHWEQAQRARWLAENGIKRMEESGAASQALLAQAYLWSGYANRILGENMCQSVIDGGAPGDSKVFLERAEAAFGQAMALGTGNVKTAATAGRASVRVDLGKWSDAVADAGAVTGTSFEYKMPYFNTGEEGLLNRLEWSSHGTPYRAHTQWNTEWEAYYLATKDPRVVWKDTGQEGDAAIDCCGKVPWKPQMKYPDAAADMRLSSAREMRLIEAEKKLMDGDMPGGVAIINSLRTLAGVANVAPASMADAWAMLKRERGIELWLEGRRLGDLRRWKAGNTPGAVGHLEQVNADSHLTRQDLCFPIPPSEQDTNPNVPKATG
jgi:hypothetical protein